MTISFNLLEHPFIPCMRLDGTPIEYGLRDVLLKAHDLGELRDNSPLVTVALHRLLLAILHRCYQGPKNSAERRVIRHAGCFDEDRISRYFERWADRFDLFHDQYPFFQCGGYAQKEPSSVNRLVKELSRGNNALLFDHTVDEPPIALTPAHAARALITEQAFAYSAGRGRTGEPHTRDAPSGRAAAVFALGNTLFETLWLNLTVYDGVVLPIAGTDHDAPVWERAPSPPYEDSSSPRGYLDFLTWQSRTIRLHPELDGGKTVIRRVSYSQGRVWNQPAGFYDPFLAYERIPGVGERAVQFRQHRELWRDSAALFQFAATGPFRGPTCLQALGTLISEGQLSTAHRYRMMIAGACVESGQPNVLFWRHETLPLPLGYLDHPELVESLRRALTLAESVKDALWKAASATAATRLTSNAEMKPDRDRVRALVDSFAPDRLYWSRLERPFRKLLSSLAADGADTVECINRWFWQTLIHAVRTAFDRSIGSLDGGRDFKAVNIGRGVLFSQLKKIRNDQGIPDRKKAGAA